VFVGRLLQQTRKHVYICFDRKALALIVFDSFLSSQKQCVAHQRTASGLACQTKWLSYTGVMRVYSTHVSASCLLYACLLYTRGCLLTRLVLICLEHSCVSLQHEHSCVSLQHEHSCVSLQHEHSCVSLQHEHSCVSLQHLCVSL